MQKTILTLICLSWSLSLLITLPAFAGFDIWLYPLKFDNKTQIWSLGSGVAITKNKKYNNQPSFTLNSDSILFASNKQSKFNDIYRYDIALKNTSPITKTPFESEYSPIETNSGINYVLEQGVPHQSVWHNKLNKPRKRTIKSLIPTGYYANHENLGTLIWARYAGDLYFEPTGESAQEGHFVVENAGRSLHRIPNEDSFSYLHNQADGEAIVKRFNPVDLSHTSLVKITGASQDYAWSNNNWLFNFKGNTLRTWQYSRQKSTFNIHWTSITQLTPPVGYKLANRLSVSPNNRHIAIVWQTQE